MYCPNCSAVNSTEQRFCRACGLNLERTTEALLEQIPTAENAKLLRRERNLEKFGQIAFTGFGVVLLAGIAGLVYAVVSRMILDGKQPWLGALLAAFIIFAALTLVYVFLRENINERKQKINPNRGSELEGTVTAKLLEERPFEPARSVTEVTTDKLFVPLEKSTSGELR